ncbi:MAG: protein translocase SEC61 complex subunit gamma [Methanobrevibacter sp.]|jgi:protein transport protein SEC61 subunit gamma-like protein|uniref:Protein translocase subunit SecE n=1 Tax=Methanobrevibacter millerae TaxID=230361 RepID=A0A8T3VCL2_9EURY|nr:protein translocase SEC61 complex subunit gamma [Methanobrevibacter millerae]MBE6504125.1 protein translocase SEC61 complex subunit gamma [Methanobrevibacter millerae]MBR0059077.1 protein translocase SEC61 complex subunit gamma [Methanobrevibacter sp.]MBR0370188.1 protein translocase SEC61 complex subunit gamma [Methanobrevibacter sp.]
MNVQERLDKFVKDSKRVLKVSRKPDRAEYFEFAKITALGILVIGVVGFVIVIIGQLIGL